MVQPAPPQAKPKLPAPVAAKPVRPEDSLKLQKLKLAALIDRVVIGKEKAQIGHVIDVLVDEKGEPAALVVDVGGFLGVGNRRIAIAWERFALAGRNFRDPLQLPLTDAQVKSAPAYDGSEEVTVIQGAVEPPGAKPTPSLDAAKPGPSPGGAVKGVPDANAKPAEPSGVEDPAVSRVDVGRQVEVSAGSGRQPASAPPAVPLHPAPGSFVPAPSFPAPGQHMPAAPAPSAKSNSQPAPPAPQQPH